MSRLIRLVALVALVVPTAALAQQKSSSSQQQTMKPQDFAKWLNQVNKNETQAAQMAQKNAQSPQVKQFAQMMLTDHQSSQQQLKQIGQQASIDVNGSPSIGKDMKAMQQMQQQAMDAMQQVPQDRFDSMFLSNMVMGHDATIAQIQQMMPQLQQATGKDAQAGQQLAQYAQQMLPKLQQHRQMAYNLLGQTGAAAQASSGGYQTQPGMGTSSPQGQGSARTGQEMPPSQQTQQQKGY